MRHEVEVLARTLVGLPSLDNNRGVAGVPRGEQGGTGPVAADPRSKTNPVIHRTAPREIRVDDWYQLDITASFVRRKFDQSRPSPLLVSNISITISWAMTCCHQPPGKEWCSALH